MTLAECLLNSSYWLVSAVQGLVDHTEKHRRKTQQYAYQQAHYYAS